jgi:hypothetical protein
MNDLVDAVNSQIVRLTFIFNLVRLSLIGLLCSRLQSKELVLKPSL